jgi:hypothetical protein
VVAKVLEVKGGDKLASALREIAAKLGSDTAAVKVGFLEGATYPGGDENAGLPVAQVAFWNEFGTIKAPPRPFFRNAIAQHSPQWGPALGSALKQGSYGARKALTLMGTLIKDQVVQSIVDTNSPPLAPSTVARKGFDKPLIDTGVMQRSVDFVVED